MNMSLQDIYDNFEEDLSVIVKVLYFSNKNLESELRVRNKKIDDLICTPNYMVQNHNNDLLLEIEELKTKLNEVQSKYDQLMIDSILPKEDYGAFTNNI